MKQEIVNRNLDAKLPQASWRPHISNYRFWWLKFWRWIRGEVNQFGYKSPMPTWYFKSRGANFTSHYFGPICVTHRSRWLKLSALTLHKEICKNDKS